MTRRRTLIAVLVVAFAGGVWFALRDTATAEDLAAADAALRRHDPFAARPPLDRILARKPLHADARLMAAKAARRDDDFAAAERHLTEYDARAGSSEASRLEWTLLGIQQGDFGDDEDRIQQTAAGKRPEAADVLEALAKGYAAAYRWTDALGTVSALIDRDANHAPARVLRAALAERFRKHQSAEEEVRRAVATAPGNPVAQAAAADFLNRHGFTREAIAHYDRALQLRPDPAVRVGKARALADAGNVSEAERFLADTASENHPVALVERGKLLLRLKRPADAEPLLARATQLAPWHRDAHQFLYTALKENGRTAEAAKTETRLAELDREESEIGRLKLQARDTPGETDVRMKLCEWCARNGRPDEAVAWITEILRVAPRHPKAHAAFANHFDRTGQPRRAALHRSQTP